jgi:hypothetical protein
MMLVISIGCGNDELEKVKPKELKILLLLE